ncbi:MAG: ABC transporter substrate-binding protein [Eubacterium sp.]|nr:ABC transporter substrate-binding protein [Eubacterium sp.]
MRKILALLMAFVLAMGLAACGSEAESTEEMASADATAEAETTEGAETYTIGVCQLVEHVALDAATQGFQDALTELLGDSVSFDIQTAQGDSATCSTITNTFVANGYDLILGNATPALQAAIASTGDIPILGTSVTDYATAMDIDDWTGVTGTNVSGTSDLAPLDQQAECIQELFPEAKTIGILYCSAEPNSKYQATVITGYLEEMGYTVSEYTFADSNDVASVTQSASTDCDVIYIPTDNTAANCTEAIANVVLNDGTPVFAGEEGICKGCGVATLSISYYDLGYATGQMAYEILVNGADPATMEIQFAPNVVKEYNAANAEALGITIPDDYEAIAEE